MTYGEELLAQGRAEARVEVVERFLRVGVTWDVIEAATGLTEAGLQTLKARLSQKGSRRREHDPISMIILACEEDFLAEGRAKGRIEVAEDFWRAGVTWDVIDAATGLVKAGFQALKRHSAGDLDSAIIAPARRT